MASNLHACRVEGRHIFLDLAADRYFRLPDALDDAFAALTSNDVPCPQPVREALARLGLATATGQAGPVAITRYPEPDRSLHETVSKRAGRVRPLDLLELTLLVGRARRIVARRQLAAAFARLADARRHHGPSSDTEQRDRLVARFLAARLYVPHPVKCLHDSLALSLFLARRHIHAELVIGVKLHPFGAHCWLQDGRTVLNDTLGSARDHVPILVA